MRDEEARATQTEGRTEGELTEETVRDAAAALASGDLEAVVGLATSLRLPDLADLITLLEPDARVQLIEALGEKFDFEVLSELDPGVRDQLGEALPNELLARAVTNLDADDAAYIIESLEESDRQEVLAGLPVQDRAFVERVLEYPPDSAARLMQSEFVAVAPFWNVGQVIDHLRAAPELPESFAEIFVVDPTYKVLGSVDLSRLLRSKRDVQMSAIMNPDRHVVAATTEQEEVARQFERYDLVSAPVVDESQRLLGVITIDDIVDVIQQGAEADIKALAGVGEESVGDTVLDTLRSRIPWLIVNLATAIIASFVIQMFDATIEQMVALAVLMPVVASIGGNAGMQTMTVTVRALATNKLGRLNAQRVISKETIVGVLNGAVLSVIMAAIVIVWFGSSTLGLVIGAAIICNLAIAALAGILIPLALDAMELDPAPASGVFVTMVTDVVGFFAFLGLASLLLI